MPEAQACRRNGQALIGYQSIKGRPNFFRWVFASVYGVHKDGVTKEDVDMVLDQIAEHGEAYSVSEPAASPVGA